MKAGFSKWSSITLAYFIVSSKNQHSPFLTKSLQNIDHIRRSWCFLFFFFSTTFKSVMAVIHCLKPPVARPNIRPLWQGLKRGNKPKCTNTWPDFKRLLLIPTPQPSLDKTSNATSCHLLLTLLQLILKGRKPYMIKS